MKYTIEGFSQEKAVQLGMNGDDLILFRWLIDFWNTGKMKRITTDEGEEFYKISYKYIIEQLPILNIKTKESVAVRFKRLGKVGVLEFKVVEFNAPAFRVNKDLLQELIGPVQAGGVTVRTVR